LKKGFNLLSSRLVEARLTGSLVDTEDNEPIKNANMAYLVQHKVLQGLGSHSSFWKVGSTSSEAQKKLGTTEPGACRVPDRFCFSDGDRVPVFDSHDLWVEGEFGLRLGSDLPPREIAYNRDEVIEAVDGVAPSIEIVGCRLVKGISKSGRFNITADCGANVALCVGDVNTDLRKIDLPTQTAELYINRTKLVTGYGERALGDPINVMVWLANHQRKTEGLKSGQLVSTGTCTGLEKVKPGDIIELRCGSVGVITVTLEDAPGKP